MKKTTAIQLHNLIFRAFLASLLCLSGGCKKREMPVEVYDPSKHERDYGEKLGGGITKKIVNKEINNSFLRTVIKEVLEIKKNFQGTQEDKKKKLKETADQTDENKNPAVYWAAGFDPKYMRLLLDCGADVDKASRFGNTALHQAVFKGKEAMVKLLLEKGADPKKANQSGQTPLDAAKSRKNNKIIKLLQSKTST